MFHVPARIGLKNFRIERTGFGLKEAETNLFSLFFGLKLRRTSFARDTMQKC